MRLQRLRVAELRQFRAPFELTGIAPGLNIYTGPNEAGKSTLVRAIRAAFFERHRSTSVDDLRPYGDSVATPLVELDFEIAGTPYRLAKSFLQKKRCELSVGTRRYEGVEAEDVMAETLGFQFALKGASREEHWGVPGLLWIEQGAAHAVRGAVLHAADHLRKVLDDSLGEVAASGGDEIVTQVRRQRDELLTGTGRPKAAYQKAIEEAADLDRQAAELESSIAQYRAQVDQLRQLRDDHALEAKAPPWTALRVRQAAAQAELQAAAALSGELAREGAALAQISGRCALLVQRLQAADAQRQALAAREAALHAATLRHEQAVALERGCVQVETAAAERMRGARDGLKLARQEDSRTALQRQWADAQARAAELTALLEQAAAEDQRATALRREAAQQPLQPGHLATLREQHSRLAELQIRQATAATRVRFELLEGAAIDIAGEAVAGAAERLLVAPTTLTIAGVGRLHIAPGGRDLSELAQEQARLHDAHHALLQRLGLKTLTDAEARDRAQTAGLVEAEAAEKARKRLAPKGLEALRHELDAATARRTGAEAALAQLPAAPEGVTVPALAVAERQHEACGDAAEAAAQKLHAARQSLATAASECDAARRERDAVQALLADPQFQADLMARQGELVEARALEAAAGRAVAGIEARIAAARPDILQQDVDRLRRSADEAERAHQARELQIVQIEATLSTAGAQGLEETRATLESARTQRQRRLHELRARAEALDYLLQRLELRRQALTRRLQAPLQLHLNRYLQLLFPGSTLAVDEQLVPGALTRTGLRGAEAGDFDTLSFGAREQMGVLSRMAYADLLKEAGRPTLVILDDALVHSDEGRLAQMKRVLFDAAQRHQVLLFTCHPAHWRDMGVPVQDLRAGR